MTTEPKVTPRAETSSALLQCCQLAVGWHGQALLPPIDLTIQRGEFWAVIGRNGSGKTTWFKTLLGQIPAVSGQLQWQPKLQLSYIPQRNSYDPLFPATAWDVVAMGSERGWSFLGPALPAQNRRDIERAMADTATTELRGKHFSQLSEGQKQKVLLARVAASRPDLALLDEPTAAMDVSAEEETLQLIDQLRSSYDMAVVIVSHFLGVAARYADRVLLVDRERQQVHVGTPQQVLTHIDFSPHTTTPNPVALWEGEVPGE